MGLFFLPGPSPPPPQVHDDRLVEEEDGSCQRCKKEEHAGVGVASAASTRVGGGEAGVLGRGGAQQVAQVWQGECSRPPLYTAGLGGRDRNSIPPGFRLEGKVSGFAQKEEKTNLTRGSRPC